jgi:hypothetical protein
MAFFDPGQQHFIQHGTGAGNIGEHEVEAAAHGDLLEGGSSRYSKNGSKGNEVALIFVGVALLAHLSQVIEN